MGGCVPPDVSVGGVGRLNLGLPQKQPVLWAAEPISPVPVTGYSSLSFCEIDFVLSHL